MNVLLNYLLPISPRYYSVSHLNRDTQGTECIKFAFDVVDYEHKGRRVRGLCSGWFEDLLCSPQLSEMTVPLFPKARIQGPFSFSNFDVCSRAPLILIANGTGVAPFVGLLSHFAENLKRGGEAEEKQVPSKIMLFHGHRHSFSSESLQGDGLFEMEIQSHVQSGLVTYFEDCVSRPSASSDTLTPKRYVQDALKTQKDLVTEWKSQEGRLLVCGSRAMDRGVSEVLLGWDKGLLLSWEGRLLKEIWG